MNRNQIIGAVIVLLIVGGGAFYGGMSYAASQTPARSNFAAGTGGAGGFAGRGAGGTRTGGFTAGTIVANSNGTISIQQQNGSSTEIVLVGPSTQILKTTAGSASDLSVGTMVTITGTGNSDGSMTANSIQIRPAGLPAQAGMGAGRGVPISGQ